MDRAKIRMSRRGQQAATPTSNRQQPRTMHPQGGQTRRVQQVVEDQGIPVRPAMLRTRARGQNDGATAALQSIDARLAAFTTLFRQVHGLDAADQELHELRTALEAAHQEIAQLRALVNGDLQASQFVQEVEEDGRVVSHLTQVGVAQESEPVP